MARSGEVLGAGFVSVHSSSRAARLRPAYTQAACRIAGIEQESCKCPLGQRSCRARHARGDPAETPDPEVGPPIGFEASDRRSGRRRRAHGDRKPRSRFRRSGRVRRGRSAGGCDAPGVWDVRLALRDSKPTGQRAAEPCATGRSRQRRVPSRIRSAAR